MADKGSLPVTYTWKTESTLGSLLRKGLGTGASKTVEGLEERKVGNAASKCRKSRDCRNCRKPRS